MLNITSNGKVAKANIVGRYGERHERSARTFKNFLHVLNATDGRLDLYQPIDEFMGTGAQKFATDLAALGDVDAIDLYINSPGGDVFDSIAIHSLLARHPARKNVHIDGLAASAASFIAMAGDTVDIVESGRIMIHNAMGGVFGDHREMRDVADVLESLSGSIANIYAKHTGRRQDTFLKMMDAETWFTAQEAVDNRLADKIIPLAGRKSSDVAARLEKLDQDAWEAGDRFSQPAIAARLRQIA